MSKKIEGAEFSLSKIFSSEFAYAIPSYQRPYAWTKSETGELFDDLFDFYTYEKTDNYFLGSIVLIKEESNPYAEVIDGQQRLTTLTILLAIIASRLSGRDRSDYEEFLCEPGSRAKGLDARPRLSLRQKDKAFFEQYIQNINLDELLKLDSAHFQTEAQKNIHENCKLLIEKTSQAFESTEALMSFGEFLVQRCFIVAVWTPSQKSAYRVFSVMNNRGLDLLPVDIIKSDVLGQIPYDFQDAYTQKWEDLEQQIGRENFNNLFSHIRMIYTKKKATGAILEDFKAVVIATTKSETLIDSILTPYTEAFCDLRNRNYVSTKNAEKINNLLIWLNKIDNADWLPPAILFLSTFKNDSDYVLWFLTRLERLAAYMHVTAENINSRIARYAQIIDEIQNNKESSLLNPLKSVELTAAEREGFLAALNGDVYDLTPVRRNYIILRLDSFVADAAATYDYTVLTIEHVLPQTIAASSQWEKWWPNKENRDAWLNKIANLVPLTRRKNSAAQNYDFDKKKNVYFTGRGGTSSYALTSQVLCLAEWTESIITKRQHELMETFKHGWNLTS